VVRLPIHCLPGDIGCSQNNQTDDCERRIGTLPPTGREQDKTKDKTCLCAVPTLLALKLGEAENLFRTPAFLPGRNEIGGPGGDPAGPLPLGVRLFGMSTLKGNGNWVTAKGESLSKGIDKLNQNPSPSQAKGNRSDGCTIGKDRHLLGKSHSQAQSDEDDGDGGRKGALFPTAVAILTAHAFLSLFFNRLVYLQWPRP